MFGKRKKVTAESFDRATKRPVIRCSICTGEQVAGFVDSQTGKMEEVMMLRDDADRQAFMERFGIREEEISKIY